MTDSPTLHTHDRKEFHYEVDGDDGEPFAKMTLFGDGKISNHMATYTAGEQLRGKVTMKLNKPVSLQHVTLEIQGQLFTGPGEAEHMSFLSTKHDLWTHNMGDPQSTTASFLALPDSSHVESTSPPGSQVQTKPKLDALEDKAAHLLEELHLHSKSAVKFSTGEYTWTFSINLPEKVEAQALSPAGGKTKHPDTKVFDAPESFNERSVRPSIGYSALVDFMHHDGVVQEGWRVQGPFGYFPQTTPPPFPALREKAYKERAPLLGPTIDPDGWEALKPVKIKTLASKTKEVELDSTLYLAKPLSYARGSIIPLSLHITFPSEIPDSSEFSPTPTPTVLLRRRIKCQFGHDKSHEMLTWPDAVKDYPYAAIWKPSEDMNKKDGSGLKTESNTSSGLDGAKGKWFIGELHIRPDVNATAHMAEYSVEYVVAVFPPDSPAGSVDAETETGAVHPHHHPNHHLGAKEDKGSKEALLEVPISIVSHPFPGAPEPNTFSPAEKYEPEVRGLPTLDNIISNWYGPTPLGGGNR